MASTLNHVSLTDLGGGTYRITRIPGDASADTVALYAALVSTEKGDLSVLCRWLTEGKPIPGRGHDGGVVYRHKATGWSYTFDVESLNAAVAWSQGTDS